MLGARVDELFAENFTQFGELGASLSVWRDGAEIISLADGWRDREQTLAWNAETPVLFWSATKGLASACLLHVLQERGLTPEARVSEFWPEFEAHGKGQITIGEVLSHQTGLPALSRAVPVTAYDEVITALADETPRWQVGEGHGYHPRTFGFLVEEILRRITGGITLRDYWRTHFGEPLGLDVWIGVPPKILPRVAPVFPARTAPPKGDPFYAAFAQSGSPTAQAFSSPSGLHSAAALNKPEALTASFPGFGGVGTARGLAKFYAMLANDGVLDERRFFHPQTLDWMRTPRTQGPDRVLLLETAFSTGFMKDPVGTDGQKLRQLFGPSPSAFGQPGAGGSLAFADPEHGISFAYVMNQMEPGVLPGPKSLRLVDALFADL